MEEEIKNNQNIYQCKECGLHYKNKDTADKCEAWCKEHKTCNVEIIKQAEENQQDSGRPTSVISSINFKSEIEESKNKGTCKST